MVHIPKGRSGNLRADQINEMSRKSDAAITPSEGQTPLPPIPSPMGSGRYPIHVRLGTCVTEEDGLCDDRDDDNEDGKKGGEEPIGISYRHGYEWQEVMFDRDKMKWVDAEAGRSNSCFDPAYAIGVDASQDYGAMPDFNGQHAMLFPSNDSLGRPLLVFEPPADQGGLFPALVVTQAGTDCNIDSNAFYGLKRLELQITPIGTPFYSVVSQDILQATNLAEYNGSYFGAQVQTGDGGCQVAWSPTPIPTNALVFAKLLTVSEGESYYGFFAINDECITCCEEGGFATTSRPVAHPAEKMPNWIAARTQTSSLSNIDTEMRK